MSEIAYTATCPHVVDWDKTDVATLDDLARGMLIYKVAAEVAERVGGISAWRTQRSGVSIGVWFGPDRQRSRRADYYIWIEDAQAGHLHKQIATAVYREVRALMDEYGDAERDIIAAVPFRASLDQVMADRFGVALGSDDEEAGQ